MVCPFAGGGYRLAAAIVDRAKRLGLELGARQWCIRVPVFFCDPVADIARGMRRGKLPLEGISAALERIFAPAPERLFIQRGPGGIAALDCAAIGIGAQIAQMRARIDQIAVRAGRRGKRAQRQQGGQMFDLHDMSPRWFCVFAGGMGQSGAVCNAYQNNANTGSGIVAAPVFLTSKPV